LKKVSISLTFLKEFHTGLKKELANT